MFRNTTAWFSVSVNRDILRFWVSQGGAVSDWNTADYLFSAEASCPDTQRIHLSDEYVMDRATVFHSAYLSKCRLRQSTKSVPLGHYILPPVSVQREVKARIGSFIWEQDEMPGVTTPDGNKTYAEGSQLEKGKERQETPGMNTSLSRDESVCCEARFYPVNNMVSGYIHIDHLKKFSGELHDFLPFQTGHSVSRAHSRRLPYQYKNTF